ncbi:hypothetical protein PILCRDRAFT_10360 [Piloderma croceum F 1598]|uniref:Uncharacterized protein n=1 Tax=Piloderma croceum (strain F 1598) TaxID=765440 RepID=A0A0C3FIC4_PILCF|nr:hypothetical protein PILCRDRAFT_10360 [Piloderma croceum F 1598]
MNLTKFTTTPQLPHHVSRITLLASAVVVRVARGDNVGDSTIFAPGRGVTNTASDPVLYQGAGKNLVCFKKIRATSEYIWPK